MSDHKEVIASLRKNAENALANSDSFITRAEAAAEEAKHLMEMASKCHVSASQALRAAEALEALS